MNEIPENLNPLLCPSCGDSTNVVKIVYGRPNEELQEKSKQGLVYLGGCCPEQFECSARNLRQETGDGYLSGNMCDGH